MWSPSVVSTVNTRASKMARTHYVTYSVWSFPTSFHTVHVLFNASNTHTHTHTLPGFLSYKHAYACVHRHTYSTPPGTISYFSSFPLLLYKQGFPKQEPVFRTGHSTSSARLALDTKSLIVLHQ